MDNYEQRFYNEVEDIVREKSYLSKHTKRAMVTIAAKLLQFSEEAGFEITLQGITAKRGEEYLLWLIARGNAVATMRHNLSVLNNMLSIDNIIFTPAVLCAIDERESRHPSSPLKQARTLSLRQVQSIIEAIPSDTSCTRGLTGARDKAIILLMFCCTLRGNDVRNLKIANIEHNAANREFVVSVTKWSKKKAGSINHYPTTTTLSGWEYDVFLQYWEIASDEEQDTDGSPYLFFPLFPQPEYGKQLSPNTVARMITRRSRDAGLQRVSSHSFRRSGATLIVDNGFTEIHVAKKMGASVSTAHRYASDAKMNKVDKTRAAQWEA